MNILKTLSRFVGISNSAKRALRAVADEQQAALQRAKETAISLRSSMGYAPTNPFTRLRAQWPNPEHTPPEFLDVGSDIAELMIRAQVFPGDRVLLIAPADLAITDKARRQLHACDVEVFLPFEDMLSNYECGAAFLREAHYDTIVLPLSAGYFTSLNVVLEACRRMLKPGGRLVIADYTICAYGTAESYYIESLDYRFRTIRNWEVALDLALFDRVRVFSRAAPGVAAKYHPTNDTWRKTVPVFSYTLITAELLQKDA